jgi:hypothetical protein
MAHFGTVSAILGGPGVTACEPPRWNVNPTAGAVGRWGWQGAGWGWGRLPEAVRHGDENRARVVGGLGMGDRGTCTFLYAGG